jgi:hypothetical protein
VSQALSSEGSISRLHARVVQVLSAMTGATGVGPPLWDAGRRRHHTGQRHRPGRRGADVGAAF